jgi:protein Tex
LGGDNDQVQQNLAKFSELLMNYAVNIAKHLSLRSEQVAATINLLDEGNTIPFIARYRKEMTGTLDEEQLRQIESLLERLRAMDERRATIIASIEEQEKMTPELLGMINAAETMTALRILYQPYKPKRRTRASIAREKGLQPLADLILQQARTKESVDVRAELLPMNEDVLVR